MNSFVFTEEYPLGTLKLVSTVYIVRGTYCWETKALWDTGATRSVISKHLANSIGLPVHSRAEISSVTTDKITERHVVELWLKTKKVRFKDLLVVSETIERQGIGFIIGMDIISKGDFVITNANGKTVLSVRFPSTDTIDFAIKP